MKSLTTAINEIADIKFAEEIVMSSTGELHDLSEPCPMNVESVDIVDFLHVSVESHQLYGEKRLEVSRKLDKPGAIVQAFENNPADNASLVA